MLKQLPSSASLIYESWKKSQYEFYKVPIILIYWKLSADENLFNFDNAVNI